MAVKSKLVPKYHFHLFFFISLKFMYYPYIWLSIFSSANSMIRVLLEKPGIMCIISFMPCICNENQDLWALQHQSYIGSWMRFSILLVLWSDQDKPYHTDENISMTHEELSKKGLQECLSAGSGCTFSSHYYRLSDEVGNTKQEITEEIGRGWRDDTLVKVFATCAWDWAFRSPEPM